MRTLLALALVLSACETTTTVNNYYAANDATPGDIADAAPGDIADVADTTTAGDIADTADTTAASDIEVIKVAGFITVIGSLTWQTASSPMAYKWTEAQSFCENLTLESFSDWRLPTFEELQKVIDTAHATCPFVVAPLKATSSCGLYWSSTLVKGSSSKAWGVDFNFGAGSPPGNSLAITTLGRARCVR
jgi:hypothetical protein